MQLVLKQSPSRLSFRDFVFVENRVYCLIILALMALQFTVFKLCYPFPDFFSDSYSYIEAAFYGWDVNIWPIGYSRFLLLFHWVTTSGLALVGFQYLVWSLSALYFYLTIVFFYHTGRNTRIFLCLFLFFNPLFLYLANYVTSDMLFVSMSTLWLAQLIWILRRPKAYIVFTQALLMFIMFTFRYNAMIYPLVAAAVILLSKQRIGLKTLGIIAGPALILPFILWSSQATKIMTGRAQFPPILGGWQWGNNALYMRGFIEEDSTVFPTSQTAELDRIARRYFSQPDRPQDLLFSEVANYFIRHWDAPLKVYMGRHYHPKTDYEDVAAWGKSAVVFDQYGKFLIKRHPLAFARYYLLVNTKNYFIPPLEKLEVYNLGGDEMWQAGQYWFHYPSPKVWSISKGLQGIVLGLFPVFFLILNLYYVVGLYLFIRRGGLRRISRNFVSPLLIITGFLALNAGFSIFANIIVIRYEIFPMIVFLTFAMLLTDYGEILLPKNNQITRTSINRIDMKKTLLADIIVLFFMLLFVYTGVAKLSETHLFKDQLSSSPFLGPFASIVTWALPIGEILLAIALLIPRFRLKALYATLALMSIFTVYVVVLLFIDDHLSCSCGGIIEELSPRQHVLFNTVCVILSALAIVVEKRQALSSRLRWTTTTSTLCLFLLLGWTLFTAFTAPATIKTGMEGRLLPKFDLLLTDSTTHLNTADIPTGEPVIVIGFSPYCIHCQAETRDLIKHMQQFQHTRIFFVTAFPYGPMKEFYKVFKLAQYRNIVVGRDTSDYFLKYFKADGVPYTAIFDSKKRLKQVMPGEAKATFIAQFAAE